MCEWVLHGEVFVDLLPAIVSSVSFTFNCGDCVVVVFYCINF